jgi:hypothetical protein
VVEISLYISFISRLADCIYQTLISDTSSFPIFREHESSCTSHSTLASRLLSVMCIMDIKRYQSCHHRIDDRLARCEQEDRRKITYYFPCDRDPWLIMFELWTDRLWELCIAEVMRRLLLLRRER